MQRIAARAVEDERAAAQGDASPLCPGDRIDNIPAKYRYTLERDESIAIFTERGQKYLAKSKRNQLAAAAAEHRRERPRRGAGATRDVMDRRVRGNGDLVLDEEETDEEETRARLEGPTVFNW
jgi:hypothetical protein